MWRHA
jgi:hypothetical protein